MKQCRSPIGSKDEDLPSSRAGEWKASMLSYDDDGSGRDGFRWLRMVTSPSCVGRRPDMRDRLGEVRAGQPEGVVDPYTVRPHHSTPHEQVPGMRTLLLLHGRQTT